MNEIIFNGTYTNEAKEFFRRYKDGFGKTILAQMDVTKGKCDYKLTLTNDKNERMIFNGGLTSGYVGEGANATKDILKDLGFDITDDFVAKYTSFQLQK